MTLPTGWASDSNYGKEHTMQRPGKAAFVGKPTPGASNPKKNHEADIARGEGASGMNAGEAVKDAKHQQGARAAALDTWKRGVASQHRADGSGSVTKQHTGHAPYHKPNTSAHANGLAMWQEGVDNKHDEEGQHDVPNQFNNK